MTKVYSIKTLNYTRFNEHFAERLDLPDDVLELVPERRLGPGDSRLRQVKEYLWGYYGDKFPPVVPNWSGSAVEGVAGPSGSVGAAGVAAESTNDGMNGVAVAHATHNGESNPVPDVGGATAEGGPADTSADTLVNGKSALQIEDTPVAAYLSDAETDSALNGDDMTSDAPERNGAPEVKVDPIESHSSTAPGLANTEENLAHQNGDDVRDVSTSNVMKEMRDLKKCLENLEKMLGKRNPIRLMKETDELYTEIFIKAVAALQIRVQQNEELLARTAASTARFMGILCQRFGAEIMADRDPFMGVSPLQDASTAPEEEPVTIGDAEETNASMILNGEPGQTGETASGKRKESPSAEEHEGRAPSPKRSKSNKGASPS